MKLQFQKAAKSNTNFSFNSQKIAPRFFSTRSLEGKRAIVTGSTSGIGLGIANALAKHGCKLLINGFGDQISSLTKKLAAENATQVEFHGADLSKPPEIHDLFNHAKKTLGGVDILINNAGIQHVSPIESFPDDKWNAIVAINLSAVFHTTKLAVPFMRAQNWGRIINISSVHGLVASANKAPYVASKHGVVGLTKAVALETAGTGVTTNCINPGWVRTPLVEAQIQAKATQLGVSIEEATKQLLAEKQPSKTFVTVDDIGATVIFLCSPAANQITGISLPLDGGWTSQ